MLTFYALYKNCHSFIHYPSLMSLTVSVDVKHHVYLLTYHEGFQALQLHLCVPAVPRSIVRVTIHSVHVFSDNPKEMWVKIAFRIRSSCHRGPSSHHALMICSQLMGCNKDLSRTDGLQLRPVQNWHVATEICPELMMVLDLIFLCTDDLFRTDDRSKTVYTPVYWWTYSELITAPKLYTHLCTDGPVKNW